MFTSSPLTALSAVLIFAAAVRGDAACDLTTVYPGASQFLTSLSVHASSLFDGKDSLAGMTVFVPTDKFLDDSGITMFSLGAFQGENALPVMRRHVFAVDPFANAAASDGAALRNYAGALYVTQTRAYASPTNLRIGAAGQPAEEGALVRRATLRGCGDVTVHIIDRLLPEPSAEFNGVLYTNMERLLPVEPPQCTPLLAALRTIKGASTFLASDRIHDFERMAQPDPGEKAMLTVLVPNNAAFKAYETFDPPAFSQMMSDPSTWRKVASLHIVKTHWAQADGPDSMQLKTLAWCDSGPCMLSATVDDAGQAFVRPLRGEGPEARASTHGVAFCHGIIYPIDDVLRIDDATEVVAAAEEEDGGSAIGEDDYGVYQDEGDADAAGPVSADDYGVYEDEGDADAAPGVGSAGADYSDAGDSVGLAPRAVLAGDQAEAVDGVEERGSNADPPGGAREEREPSDDPYIDAGSVIPDKEEWEQERTREGVPDAAGDGAADYTEDEGAGEVADAPDGREPSDDPFIDAGSVIPDKEEWEQERAREQA